MLEKNITLSEKQVSKQFRDLSVIDGITNNGKTNLDLSNSDGDKKAWSALIDLNRQLKAEQHSLNTVLKIIVQFYDSHAFKSFNTALKREKNISFLKADFDFKKVKQLYPTAQFYTSKDFQPKLMCKFAKIADKENASYLIGDYTALNGEKLKLDSPKKIYFEKIVNNESVYYTLKPITKFTAWSVLRTMTKLKEQELKNSVAKVEK